MPPRHGRTRRRVSSDVRDIRSRLTLIERLCSCSGNRLGHVSIAELLEPVALTADTPAEVMRDVILATGRICSRLDQWQDICRAGDANPCRPCLRHTRSRRQTCCGCVLALLQCRRSIGTCKTADHRPSCGPNPSCLSLGSPGAQVIQPCSCVVISDAPVLCFGLTHRCRRCHRTTDRAEHRAVSSLTQLDDFRVPVGSRQIRSRARYTSRPSDESLILPSALMRPSSAA